MIPIFFINTGARALASEPSKIDAIFVCFELFVMYTEFYFKSMECVILGRNGPLDASQCASHVRCMPRVRLYLAGICPGLLGSTPLIGDSASSISNSVSTFVGSHGRNHANARMLQQPARVLNVVGSKK